MMGTSQFFPICLRLNLCSISYFLFVKKWSKLVWLRKLCANTVSVFPRKFGVVAAQGSLKSSLNLKLTFKPSRNIHMENKENSSSRGALIVLEGLDRCGKTSQSSRLYKYLDEQGYSVESWRFPDRNTGVGQMISSYLANQAHLDDHAIHLLFSANRWEKRCAY